VSVLLALIMNQDAALPPIDTQGSLFKGAWRVNRTPLSPLYPPIERGK
jgi:hypothetical protein